LGMIPLTNHDSSEDSDSLPSGELT
jgi:hypothetical protein